MKNQQPVLENIANKVISKMPSSAKDENFGFVITVLMIISIVLTIVRVIQECDKKKTGNYTQQEKYAAFGEQSKTLSIKRSWFTKMTIKKIIRKEMTKEDYKKYSYDLMNAILDTGENLTKDEIKTLVETTNV
jgi:hypothetical protein